MRKRAIGWRLKARHEKRITSVTFPDTTAPAVTLTAPLEVGVDESAPYEAVWSTLGALNGNYRISAVGRDAAGNASEVSANAYVQNDSGLSSDAIRIINPVDGASVCGRLTAEAAVSLDSATIVFSLDETDVATDSTAIAYTGESRYDAAGACVAGVGDVNSDGYDDLIIGAPNNEEGPSEVAGAAYLVLGSSSPASQSLTAADASYRGNTEYDAIGQSASAGGDINADGYDDMLVAAWGHDDGVDDSNGSIYLFLGSATPASMAVADADAKFSGHAASDFAARAANVGDADGDGHHDFVSGAFGNDDGPGNSAGSVYIVLGESAPASRDLIDADAQLTGEADSDSAGRSVSGAGDTNGDRYQDLLVGAYGNDDGGSATSAGAAYLVLGGASPASISLALADYQYGGEERGHGAGGAVSSAGDVDATGYAGLLFGADEYGGSAGAAYLILGGGF